MIFKSNLIKEEEIAGTKHQISQRFERKFFVPPEKRDIARSLLTHLCLADSQFPRNRINSLYFDTFDLEQFQKSIDGSYEREKIRIRWYDNTDSQTGMVPVYLELKTKRGFTSRKQRKKIMVPAENLRTIRANNTIASRQIILQTLSEFGYFSEKLLLPVIFVTYRRYRFSEIMTGVRLSFDWEINSLLAQPWLGHGEAKVSMEGGVIEIKGPSMQIPRSLRPLISLTTDWTRFSKYAGSLELHMEKPGSVGRMWPSGRTKLL